jgi:hypothetical protein
MDFLFGSQDGTHEGIFSATSKKNWLCGLVECRRGEQKITELWNSKRLIVGGEAPNNDKAAGNAIVLSPGLVNAVQDQGCYPPGVGCRILWVQLATRLGVPLIVIVVYIPHHGRSNPCADDVYDDLRELMAILPERSIKVVIGDFNGRLARAYQQTGETIEQTYSFSGGKLLARTAALWKRVLWRDRDSRRWSQYHRLE